MDFLEKNLEEIIYEAPNDELLKRGLPINGIIKRQLRIGNYGIADLVTFEKFYEYEYMPFKIEDNVELHSSYSFPAFNVTVYELKRDRVDISTYLQGIRYLKGIKQYLENRSFKQGVRYNLVLIGKNIDKSDSMCYIPEFNNKISIYTYSYNYNGISFKEEIGYKLINEGFNLKSFKNEN